MRTILNVPYLEDGNPMHLADLYLPDEPGFATFLFFHGGGMTGGSKDVGAFAGEYLAKRGWGVVSADYRLMPEVEWPAFLEDAAAAVAWTKSHIAEYGGSGKLYVGGNSAGAYMSMMLQFDRRWLAPHGIVPTDIAGYVHAAGQPTAHFAVLESRGIDKRRVIVDETAPLYYVGCDESYSPMLLVISENDMRNRLEQTELLRSTLLHFGVPEEDVCYRIMPGKHCRYVREIDENGDSVFGKLAEEFFRKTEERA